MQEGVNDDIHVIIVLDVVETNIPLKVGLVRKVIGRFR